MNASQLSSLRQRQQQGGMMLYIIVAIVLMVITYIEFAIVEYDIAFLSRGAILFWLFALSILKFALVVWVFMHLKDDDQMLSGLFSTGMVIGGGTVAAVLMLFTVFNANAFARSPYLPTLSYGNAQQDQESILQGVAFIDAMDNPAPKMQVVAIAPRQVPERSALNLPQLALTVPDFQARSAEAQQAEVEAVQSVQSDPVQSEAVQSESVAVTPPQQVDAAQPEAVEPIVAEPVTSEAEQRAEVATGLEPAPVASTEVANLEDVDTLLSEVKSLRAQLTRIESLLATQGDGQEPVTTETAEVQPQPAQPQAEDSTAAGVQEAVADEPEPEAAPATVASYAWDWQAQGETAYSANCASCHQANGQGIPGAFPPLKNHIATLYNTEAGRTHLVNLVLYGMQGEITVDGVSYNGVMTGLGYLSDEELAAALNHGLNSWGNNELIEEDFAPIVPEEIAEARATQKTMAEVYTMRQGLELP